jgi:hypothetical protein
MKQLTLLVQIVVTLFGALLSAPTHGQATIGTCSLRALRLGPTNAMNVANLRLTAHRISLSRGRSFDLNLPEGFEISVAAQGHEAGALHGGEYGARIYVDQKYNALARKITCRNVPPAYVAFAAHSSPLGLDYFGASNSAELNASWLVALHGSTKKSLNHGYRLVRLSGAAPTTPDDFITGFLQGRKVNGRPADVLRFGTEAFLFTDDYAGVVYYVYKSRGSTTNLSRSSIRNSQLRTHVLDVTALRRELHVRRYKESPLGNS